MNNDIRLNCYVNIKFTKKGEKQVIDYYTKEMRLGELNSKKQPNGTYNFVVYELKPIFKGSIAKVEEFIEEMTSLGLSFEEDECTNFFQGNKEFVKKLTSIHESIK